VDSENIIKLTEKVVLHAAEKGNCVIVGRGSQHFLMKREDTVRIFLYAPMEEKVRRLLLRGKTEQEAYDLVDTVDRERADFIGKYFKMEWPNRSLYHAMINTAIGDETVVRTILNVVEAFDSRSAAQV
jgi:cytidylate kinase